MLANGANLRVNSHAGRPGWNDDGAEPAPQGVVVGSALSAATGLAGDSKGAVCGSATGSDYLAALRLLALLPTHFFTMLRRALQTLNRP
jgi:hypothetical protein